MPRYYRDRDYYRRYDLPERAAILEADALALEDPYAFRRYDRYYYDNYYRRDCGVPIRRIIEEYVPFPYWR